MRNHDRARARAEQASRAKSEFLATMSHEIRTPMNGVLGMLRLMADGPLNERQRQQVRVMRSSSEILLGILNDILDYSRVESGEIEVERAVFDLHELVEDIVVLMQGRAQGEEPRTRARHCRGRAGGGDRRPAEAEPGAAQPARQRHQVHRSRRRRASP